MTLSRTANIVTEHRAVADEDDVLERKERAKPLPNPSSKPRALTAVEVESLRAQDWHAWLRSHLDVERAAITKEIAEALAEHDAIWREVHAQVLVQERRHRRDGAISLKRTLSTDGLRG